MPKNKLQSYQFLFCNYKISEKETATLMVARSYKNRVSAVREAKKLLKIKTQKFTKAIIQELKNGKFETIKEIKNEQ